MGTETEFRVEAVSHKRRPTQQCRVTRARPPAAGVREPRETRAGVVERRAAGAVARRALLRVGQPVRGGHAHRQQGRRAGVRGHRPARQPLRRLRHGGKAAAARSRAGPALTAARPQGEGGYFETPLPWRAAPAPEGRLAYGDRAFASREELRAYVRGLPPAEVRPPAGRGPGAASRRVLQVGAAAPARAVLRTGAAPRVALVCANGRQLAHYFLPAALAVDVVYL